MIGKKKAMKYKKGEIMEENGKKYEILAGGWCANGHESYIRRIVKEK